MARKLRFYLKACLATSCSAVIITRPVFSVMMILVFTSIAWALHAFVLMTNHVHLLLTPEDTEGISRVM
jgi:REP element-mobilizing transposase RayT